VIAITNQCREQLRDRHDDSPCGKGGLSNSGIVPGLAR
jgi:hypothetical protein